MILHDAKLTEIVLTQLNRTDERYMNHDLNSYRQRLACLGRDDFSCRLCILCI